MRDYTENGIAGELGRSVKSYQKTLKRRPGQIPWRKVWLSVRGKLFVSFSFDGRTYSEEIALEGGFEFQAAVRAVRVRVSRACDHAYYAIVCRD